MCTFEWPLTYGGLTLKPVVCVAILLPIGRLEVAGTVASKRQLTGVINSDDSFRAAKSVDRLQSLEPKRDKSVASRVAYVALGVFGSASRSARILKAVKAGSASKLMRPAA